MASMEEIVQVLDELFVIFNFLFFQGELIKPVITAQSNSRRKPSVMGWCTTKRMWKETSTEEEYFEIAICPEFFDLGLEEIVDTLLHELVHLYHQQMGIQDTSRGGHYHNQVFKKKAEGCGMIVEKSPTYGWALTRLSLPTRAFVEQLKVDREAFNLIRKRPVDLFVAGLGLPGAAGGTEESIPPPPRQSYRKYVCPSCSMTVRATKDVNVKCGDCDLEMEKQEK